MNQGNTVASPASKHHLLFSKEAMVVTKVDQTLVIEIKATDTIPHCKALKIKINSKINVGS